MKQALVIISGFLFASLAAAQTGSPTRPAGQPEVKKVETNETSDRVPVATGKYITGGILGSALGLGIGHAVQGRYQERGWIFTATQAAGLAMLLGGCSNPKDRDGDGDKECRDSGLAAAGLGVMVGFRIWEVIDVWTGARPVDDSAPVAMIAPISDAPGFLISWKF